MALARVSRIGWKANALDQLVRFETILERCRGKFCRFDRAHTAPAADLQLSAERDHHSRPVCGRVGMRKAAANSAAIADRAVGDAECNTLEQPWDRRWNLSILEVGMAHGGADDDGISLRAGLRKLVESRNVDQQARGGKPQVEHRTKRLAARNEPSARSLG